MSSRNLPAAPIAMPLSLDSDDSDATNPKAPLADPDGTNPEVPAITFEGDGVEETEVALQAMTSFRLAETALQRNDLAAAEEHARKALAGDPDQPDYLTLVAWIRAQQGAPQVVEDAIRTMSKVLIEDPSNEQALLYRGKLLVKTNRLPEALNDFDELLSANPHHREAQNEARKLRTRIPQS